MTPLGKQHCRGDHVHGLLVVVRFEQVAVAIHRHLHAATPAKVCTVVFGFRSASIQHEIAKCRSACQLKRFGTSGYLTLPVENA